MTTPTPRIDPQKTTLSNIARTLEHMRCQGYQVTDWGIEVSPSKGVEVLSITMYREPEEQRIKGDTIR